MRTSRLHPATLEPFRTDRYRLIPSMIDELQSVTVVGLGVTDADLADAVADVATEAADDLLVQTVATPAALATTLDERRVACVVLAPDDADWGPVAVLESLAANDRQIPAVLVTDAALDAAVDAGVVGAISAVVRPGDGAALATRVAAAVERYCDRECDRCGRERYEALVEHSPAPIAIVDAEGAVRVANEALADLLAAASPTDLVGESVTSFVAPDSREASARRLRRVVADGTAMPASQRTFVDATGEEKYALVAMAPATVGGDPAAQLVFNDVTEHKRLQAALREERDRFSTLFESLTEPVVETRFSGETPVVTGVNAAFAETFGVDPEATVGDPLDDIIVPDADRGDAADFNRRAKAGAHLEREVTRRTPDGLRDFLFRFVPYGEDEPGGYAIYIDITERRERERQLQRQNERLEEVAAVVSHDLRNPLNVAHGTVDALAKEADAGERDLFERVLTAHERMEAIIDEMLTLARQGQSVSDLEPVALARAAHEAWETTETGDATLVVKTESRIRADESRLRQAVENLFRNAVEHGGHDVTVTVGDLSPCPSGEGDVDRPRRRGGFYVEDDGRGVPADEREAVFESGYTTADDGTGFGLAIVQSVVEAHGWDVSVGAGTEGGARFEVTGVEYAA